MDESLVITTSTEDLSSIGTTDIDNNASSSSLFTRQIDSVDLEQLDELTKQLNESKTAEKRAIDERDKYLQLYNRTNERFLLFEHKQLDQMRRILNMLTFDQHKTLSDTPSEYRRPRRAFTSPSTSMLLPSSLNHPLDNSEPHTDFQKTENEWKQLYTQISEIMEFSERFTIKFTKQTEENQKLRILNTQKQEENAKLFDDLTLTKAEYEKEQQIRGQFERQFNDANQTIEQDRSKRLQKLRNYASLADDEGDILLSSLMKKAEKNDVDFREIQTQYENTVAEQVNQLKKLIKERELSHVYIRRLEIENSSLAARTNDDETVRLLTHSSQSPTSYEEAWDLIKQLREEIIEQVKLRDQLKNDIEQLKYSHKTDLREREQIEELLSRDLTGAKDEIMVLQSVRSEYEHVLNVKKDLERQLEGYTNDILQIKTVANSLTNQLKEKVESLSSEKEKLDEDNAGLRVQIQKLRNDFENSESVQHDFVKLSQALQMQLEDIRNSDNELRWKPEEDFSNCQQCQQPFSVTWRKHHCRHCGKVLCKDCTSKVVHTGPHRRPSRVCEVCYTILVKNAQPYFLDAVTKS